MICVASASVTKTVYRKRECKGKERDRGRRKGSMDDYNMDISKKGRESIKIWRGRMFRSGWTNLNCCVKAVRIQCVRVGEYCQRKIGNWREVTGYRSMWIFSRRSPLGGLTEITGHRTLRLCAPDDTRDDIYISGDNLSLCFLALIVTASFCLSFEYVLSLSFVSRLHPSLYLSS